MIKKYGIHTFIENRVLWCRGGEMVMGKICIRFGILLREVRTPNQVCSGVSNTTGGKRRGSCTFLWLPESPQSKENVLKNKSKTTIINRAKSKCPCLRLLWPPAFTSELGLKWRAELFPFGYVKLKILN